MHQVLVVEDEADIRVILRVLLEANDYRVVEAETAERAEIEARSHKPDLLLVDLGLPDADGLEIIRRVRHWSSVPIVVLSARAMEEQKIAALDAGADDYVTKPFSAPELLARVRAALRRNVKAGEAAPLRFGGITVDLPRRAARDAEREVHLTPLEYRVLECLVRQLGMIVRREQLMREVWGPERSEDTRVLRVCIKNLRQKLEPDPRRPRYLVTEAGLGYRLRVDEEAPEGARPKETLPPAAGEEG
jgi:two-component system KDP operon response regulator KdpE